jgi:hypothetical protein
VLWILGALEFLDTLGVSRKRALQWRAEVAVSIGIAAVFLLPFSGAIAYPLGLRSDSGLLGRYFVGEQPGTTAPHIVRIDRELSFDNIAQMGAMPFPSVVIWAGRLIVPQRGIYRFVIDADDAGWMAIDGRVVIPDPGPVNRPHAEGGISLAAGIHRIEVGERNIGGDSSIHVYWQRPGQMAEIIPSADLIPDHP